MIPTYAGLPKRKIIRNLMSEKSITLNLTCSVTLWTPKSQFRQKRLRISRSKNGTIIYLSSTYIVHVIRISSQTGYAVRFVDTFMKSVRRMEAIFLPLEWRPLAFPSYSVQLHLTHLMSYWLPPLLVTETWPEFVFILLIFKWVVFVSFFRFYYLVIFPYLLDFLAHLIWFVLVVSLPHISLS